MDEKEYALIPVGTEVSAKFKGAFCEAKIGKVKKCIKCRVVFDGEQGSSVVLDENVKGSLKIGEKVEARTSPSKPYRRATVTKIVDDTTYTVVFNDGDERSLKRNQLCIKGDKHFTESESLDSMPLVHPEEFGSPVVNSKEKKDDSWIGQIVCIEFELKFTGQTVNCPCLVVVADPQGRRAKKDQLIVRSFMDNKFMTVQRKETKSFRMNDPQMQDNSSSQSSDDGDKKNSNRGKASEEKHQQQTKALTKAMERAVAYWENDVLPDGWNRSQLVEPADDDAPSAKRGSGGNNAKDESDNNDSSSSLSSFESSDEEGHPSEERDRFVAQLYRFMDERGTPLNKAPSLANKDLDLYRLYSIVQHCGGFNRVNRHDKWLSIYKRMHIPQAANATTARNQIIRAYKKYLQPFEDFYRKLGSTMGTVDVWGRTRNALSRAFISTREKSQSRSESRLNSSGNPPPTTSTPATATIPTSATATAISNNNSTTAANTTSSTSASSSTVKQTPSSTASQVPQSSGKSPSSQQQQQQQPVSSSEKASGEKDKSQLVSTPVASGSSTASNRRSLAMGESESDSKTSTTTPASGANNKPPPKDSASNNRRSRRESQSKEVAVKEEAPEPQPEKRIRRTSQARGRRRTSSGPPSGRATAGGDSDDDVDDSEGDNNNNEDNVSSHSGDDGSATSSSTEFGNALLPSVAAAAGIPPNSNAPLPLETCVKVKCGHGSVTATYEGKINARKKNETDGEYRYHIHYRGWNSRYDEWIVAGRICHIIRIGEETSSNSSGQDHQPLPPPSQQQQPPQQPPNQSNLPCSRAGSVPSSVVSASESDLAGSADELQPITKTVETTPTVAKKEEEVPPVVEKETADKTPSSPENKDINSGSAEITAMPFSKLPTQTAASRKRKAEEKELQQQQQQQVKQQQQGPSEKNGASERQPPHKDKDSSSESGVTEKQPKKDTANVVATTRSTRSKPGEDPPPVVPSNGARGSGPRRGGFRGGPKNCSSKDEPVNVDPTDNANNEKLGTLSGRSSNSLSQGQFQSVAAAIAASKSPSKVAAEHRRLNRPNKFNFHFEEIDKCANHDERITFIMGKITEIRNLYGDLKSKVTDIDKKRRLFKAHMSSSSKNNAANILNSASITIKTQQQQQPGECANLLQPMSTITSDTSAAVARP